MILASIFSAQGRYDEAEPLYKLILTLPDMRHQKKLGIKVQLAQDYCYQRQFHAAEELLQEALAGFRKLHGSENIHSLWIAKMLDDCRREMGKASRDG